MLASKRLEILCVLMPRAEVLAVLLYPPNETTESTGANWILRLPEASETSRISVAQMRPRIAFAASAKSMPFLSLPTPPLPTAAPSLRSQLHVWAFPRFASGTCSY